MKLTLLTVVFLFHLKNGATASSEDPFNNRTELLSVFDHAVGNLEIPLKLRNVIRYVVENLLHPFSLADFLQSHGYPSEEHHVITEDGYNLTIFRVPHGRSDTSEKKRPAVLFMHGLGSSSIDYVKIGPNRSLALQLADLGYDIWLGNNRGTVFNTGHIKLKKRDPRYWDFSFEDMSKDVSSIVDYILDKTGNAKLSYVGHSQGTSQVFALLALKPKYNDKFVLVNALAPVAYMSRLTSPVIRLLAINLGPIQLLAKLFNVHEIIGYNRYISILLGAFCHPDLNNILCPILLFAISGYSPYQYDKDYIPTFLATVPAGSAFKTIVHYGQVINSGHFRQFDYGAVQNMLKYGRLSPPDYKLSNIVAPIALYYGPTDGFAAIVDVEKFAKQLPSPKNVHQHLIQSKYFNHLDFLFSKDMNELLNNFVIKRINDYNRK